MTNETVPPAEKPSTVWPAPKRHKQNEIPVLVGLVFFLLGLGVGYLVWGRNPASTAATAPTAAVNIPQKVTRFNVSVDDDPAVGPADAPITLIEFSDYQCPFCTKWDNEVYARLLKEYSGKIRFVYRDLPLAFHGDSQSAAEAANCAGEQGAYWKFHDALFSEKYGLGADAYRKYATDLGLDAEALIACVNSGKYTQEVMADAADAAGLGVSSTPTFFINGIQVVGAQPYEYFKQIIDLELAGKIPQ
jgi:protein-disulfide isomerase